MGKVTLGRTRPIIVRFVCREDRNGYLVWLNRSKLKQSAVYPDAYSTEDFARPIQGERKVLIKAMKKAKDELRMKNVKVFGRYLCTDNQRCERNKIPDFLNLFARFIFSLSFLPFFLAIWKLLFVIIYHKMRKLSSFPFLFFLLGGKKILLAQKSVLPPTP